MSSGKKYSSKTEKSNNLTISYFTWKESQIPLDYLLLISSGTVILIFQLTSHLLSIQEWWRGKPAIKTNKKGCKHYSY